MQSPCGLAQGEPTKRPRFERRTRCLTNSQTPARAYEKRQGYETRRETRARTLEMDSRREKLIRLLNSALFVDSIWRPGDWKCEADLTPEERERGERWRQWASQRRPVTSYSRGASEMTWAEFKRQAEAAGVTNDTEVVLLEGWHYEPIISLDDDARLVITQGQIQGRMIPRS
jgi:hypothetical protein